MCKIILFSILISQFFIVQAQTAFNLHFDNDTLADVAGSVCQSNDGGYLLGGKSWNFNTGYDFSYFIKTDCNGQIIWKRIYDFSTTGDEYVESIIQRSNGDYLICGGVRDTSLFTMDGFLLCLNKKGDLKWFKKYGGNNDDVAYQMKQTTDGNFVFVGYANSNVVQSDAWLFKTDSIGNIIWEKYYGGTNYDEAYSVDLTNDGGYIIGGRTRSFGSGGNDMYMIKTDSIGNQQWQRTFGNQSDEWGEEVKQTADGGYIFVGSIWVNTATGSSQDAIIIKTDSAGYEQWRKTLGHPNFDGLYHVEVLPDGSYLTAGGTYVNTLLTYEGWLVKLDQNGDSLWSRTYGGSKYGEYIYDLKLTSDGGFVMAGQDNRQGSPYQDMWLIKTDSNGCDQPQCNNPCYACGYIEPKVTVSADTLNLLVGNSMHFFDQSVFVQHRLWSFDDGTTDTVQNPVHVFNTVGTYHIKLIAFFNNCSDTAYYTVCVENVVHYRNISGTVTYSNNLNTPLSNVILYLKQNGIIVDSTVTDFNGSYFFSSKPTGTYIISAITTKPWSNITSTDALLIDRHVAGLSILTEPKLSAADVNQNNNISSADALLLKRRVVGLQNSFPAGDWYFNPQPITVSNANVIMNFEGICYGDANGSYVPQLQK